MFWRILDLLLGIFKLYMLFMAILWYTHQEYQRATVLLLLLIYLEISEHVHKRKAQGSKTGAP